MFSRSVLIAAVVSAVVPRVPAEQGLDLQLVSREVSTLRDEVTREATLSQWRATHPAARIDTDASREWCVEATYIPEWTRDNLPMEVVARFDPPATPASLELPAASPRVTGACRLQHFTIRVPGDASRTTTLAELSRALTQRLGASVAPTDWRGPKPIAFWTSPTASVALTEFRQAISVSGVRRDAGLGIQSGGGDLSYHREAYQAALAPRVVRLDEALRLAGADEAPVRRLFERIATSPDKMAGSETDLIAGMEALLEGRPPDAARYLAAELIIVFAQNAGVADMTRAAPAATPLRLRLQRLGVRFAYAELGRAYLYDHGLLKAASKLPASERVEELVFLTYLEIGFETSFACRDQKGAGFRAVITRGRKFLVDHPDTKIAGAIYRNLAKAYGDALMTEGIPEIFNAAEARAARPRAIDAYLEAVKREGVTPQTTALWPDMWRMRAGLAPRQSYFVCSYD